MNRTGACDSAMASWSAAVLCRFENDTRLIESARRLAKTWRNIQRVMGSSDLQLRTGIGTMNCGCVRENAADSGLRNAAFSRTQPQFMEIVGSSTIHLPNA